MIHYQLRCDHGHAFEGWFRDSVSFERQAATGLLSCPECGTTGVERGLMAPAIRTSRSQPAPEAAAAGSGSANVLTPAEPPTRMPDQMRAALQRMRADIERECDHVGDDFAAEALRMHRGETERRGIYGNASEDDREVLADEGVAVVQIPWLKPADT